MAKFHSQTAADNVTKAPLLSIMRRRPLACFKEGAAVNREIKLPNNQWICASLLRLVIVPQAVLHKRL